MTTYPVEIETSTEEFLESFQKISEDLYRLVERKTYEYHGIRKHVELGDLQNCLMLIKIRVRRLENLTGAAAGQTLLWYDVKDKERVYETLGDLANYCMLAMHHIRAFTALDEKKLARCRELPDESDKTQEDRGELP